MPRTKQFNEEEVLRKAMELFWKQGYHATSIQNLVDQLGINRASLYDTFGGKDALFEKAFEKYVRDYSAQVIAQLSRHESVRRALEAFFLSEARAAARDKDHKGCFVVNTTTEFVPNSEEWAQRITRQRKAMEHLFLQYLQRAVEQGEIPPGKDLPALAAYLFTFYNGLKVVSKANDSEEELCRVVQVALSVLD
ncbi:MAG: TetR/AcrR family transcriptional regulator [Lewinellaceae bacterium]|nr:TetR/AcrR family transcriptional regulator [Lewinellaceae bacterium]MCB9291098.1 TetR/AcrR family transcriptional regulator [Lewinellaceae bacterium]